MQKIIDFSNTLAQMSPASLNTLIILSAFALAAYAMYMAGKGRKNG